VFLRRCRRPGLWRRNKSSESRTAASRSADILPVQLGGSSARRQFSSKGSLPPRAFVRLPSLPKRESGANRRPNKVFGSVVGSIALSGTIWRVILQEGTGVQRPTSVPQRATISGVPSAIRIGAVMSSHIAASKTALLSDWTRSRAAGRATGPWSGPGHLCRDRTRPRCNGRTFRVHTSCGFPGWCRPTPE
jgi:hypothetical protein